MRIKPEELTCCQSRRDFIRIGSLGLGGVTLASMLRHQKLYASPARDLSCIVLFQLGGNSQVDTFDPKPEAPPEIRGNFKAIKTAVPGIYFTELLPKCAERLKSSRRFGRCMATTPFTKARSSMSSAAPSGGTTWCTRHLARSWHTSGVRRPAACLPTLPSPQRVAPEVRFFRVALRSVQLRRSQHENFFGQGPDASTGNEARAGPGAHGTSQSSDTRFRNTEQSGLLELMEELDQKAYDLVSSPAAKKAFDDIAQEADKAATPTGALLRGRALLARRLVEAGVRVVTVFQGGYDTHTERAWYTRGWTRKFETRPSPVRSTIRRAGTDSKIRLCWS